MRLAILRCMLAGAMLAGLAVHADDRCHVGAYRLADGSVVDIAPSEGTKLRWRRFDGTTGSLSRGGDGAWRSTYGWTGRPDGIRIAFGDCAAGTIALDGKAGRRIPLQVSETRFHSKGVTLAGRLVLPPGRERVPVVVLLHGAERDSALEFYSLQRLLPAEGVGVFVYDKRGTGASGGSYTQDFQLLASDAIAALHEARRLAGARVSRIGYQAGSQGGWVAPIAASREPVDFAIVCFGLAVSVVDEDQQEVELEMRLKGYGPDVIARAVEIARAADEVFASGFTQGFEAFDAVRARYRDEPWYKDVHGNFTHFILGASAAEIRAKGPAFLFGTPFRYDPMPALEKLEVPQLWILGGMDLEAPSAETSRRLERLIAEGRPITLALYPEAEHGMTAFESGPGGERISTRYMPGYFEMIRDFARTGRLDRAYGTSEITMPNLGSRRGQMP
jgi:pimeloyl-ACP methyl ester carboxylesterase